MVWCHENFWSFIKITKHFYYLDGVAEDDLADGKGFKLATWTDIIPCHELQVSFTQ